METDDSDSDADIPGPLQLVPALQKCIKSLV